MTERSGLFRKGCGTVRGTVFGAIFLLEQRVTRAAERSERFFRPLHVRAPTPAQGCGKLFQPFRMKTAHVA